MDVLGIVIQARIWAKRFPGKVLADLGGETVLQHVIKRCKRAHDKVIVATPDLALVPLIHKYGADAYLGSETNVLGRYIGAAQAFGLSEVVRVTADCPFVDPFVIRELIDSFHSGDYDYASNVLNRTYPYGLDCEAVKVKTLKSVSARLTNETRDNKYREHVTLFIREHLGDFSVASLEHDGDFTGYDWRLDSPGDLPYLKAVYKSAGSVLMNFLDIVSISRQYGAEHLRVPSESRSPAVGNPKPDGNAPERAKDPVDNQGRSWYERGYRGSPSGS